MIESILLSAARIFAFDQQRLLTNASGFFFERDERLFLVTSRHVMIDEPSKHFPDRIEIELHIDPENMARSTGYSIPLYREGKSIRRQSLDAVGVQRGVEWPLDFQTDADGWRRMDLSASCSARWA